MAYAKKAPEGFRSKTTGVTASRMIFESEAISADGARIHWNWDQRLISARNAILLRGPLLGSTCVTP